MAPIEPRGTFSDHAIVDGLAALGKMFDHAADAVARRPLFVAGQQHRQTTLVVRVSGDEALHGDNHRCQSGLHIGGTSPEQVAVAFGGLEGRAGPALCGAWRYDVRMARKAQRGTVLTARGPQVRNLAKRQGFDLEPQRAQTLGQHRLAACIRRSDRRTFHQRLQQREFGWLAGVQAGRGLAHSVAALRSNSLMPTLALVR